ncbi:DUF4176 domain-containing protein [Olsenella massiliensis]|uniref:DUF4176 domain-containing protein n=1 Tax=Olsenella massiliensis TaxID=1622075 RepID=UPI00071E41B8|nr:DUF4176 domain-containing protein [Olsenella massiliensis]
MLTTNQWLPIGSVVHVDGKEELVVIAGYMQQDVETGHLWEYVGLNHPTGFLKPGDDVLFDRDSIDGVVFVGLQGVLEEHWVAALEATQESFSKAKDDAEAAGRQKAEARDDD